MKRKLILILVILLITITSFIIASAGNNKAIKYKEVGKSHNKLLEEMTSKDLNNDNKKVAIVNKQVIYTYELEAAVLSHELADNSYSEEEILDNIIKNLVIVQKAKEKGYSASNERIQKEVNAIREGYENDSSYRELIIPYLEGMGMTFEEYFGYTKESLKESIIVNEMKKDQTKGMEKEEARKHWNDFIEQCISESNIKLFKTK